MNGIDILIQLVLVDITTYGDLLTKYSMGGGREPLPFR
jgi:hypothetical protein